MSDYSKRSNICGVCGYKSNTFHLNYGAASCLSCRAFFRRIVLKCGCGGGGGRGGDPLNSLKCHKVVAGDCDISHTNVKRRCHKCRYVKCLAVGMKSEMVLDLESRQKRFKKVLQKQPGNGISFSRKKPVNIPSKPAAQPPRGAIKRPSSPPPRPPRSLWRPYDLSDRRRSNNNTLSSNLTSWESICKEHISVTTSSMSMETGGDVAMKAYRDSLQRTWQSAVRMVTEGDETDWQRALLSLHTKDDKEAARVIRLRDLKRYLSRLAKAFRNFSLMQPEFNGLAGDKLRLSAKNTLIFIQYVLARYFTAATAAEQLRWLLLIRTSSSSAAEEEINNLGLKRVSFEGFVGRFSLFNAPIDQLLYEDYLKTFVNCNLTFAETPLMAVFCLFFDASTVSNVVPNDAQPLLTAIESNYRVFQQYAK